MTTDEAQALTFLAHDLEQDEGRVPYAYPDHMGYLTIGVGTLIDKRKGGRLLPEEIDFILQNRMKRVLAGAQAEGWYAAVKDDPVRLAALLNMQFQLGAGSDEEFPVTFKAIVAGDWKAAAAGMRASAWARQTPARAARVAKMIETGRRA